MRFASLGNKPEKQISRKVKNDFFNDTNRKKKPNLCGTASSLHMGLCAITTTWGGKLVKISSQIYGILFARSF
jgi:hypothetical protein